MTPWNVIVYAAAFGLGWLIVSICVFITIGLLKSTTRGK